MITIAPIWQLFCIIFHDFFFTIQKGRSCWNIFNEFSHNSSWNLQQILNTFFYGLHQNHQKVSEIFIECKKFLQDFLELFHQKYSSKDSSRYPCTVYMHFSRISFIVFFSGFFAGTSSAVHHGFFQNIHLETSRQVSSEIPT